MNNITIETLTPVHIGSGRTLQKNVDFIFFSNLKEKPIALIDEEKIFRILGEKNFGLWMKAIEEKADILPLLRKEKPDVCPQDVQYRSTYTKEANILKGELYEHIHNASAKPYLPGSSIKGAIRTGMIASLIKQEKKFVQNKDNLGRFNPRHNCFEYKDNKIIKHFVADDAEKKQQNKDIFRFLHIGDAVFQRTEAIMVNTFSLKKNGWEKREALSQWTECIPSGEKSALRINFPEQTLYNRKEQEVQNKITGFIGKNHHFLKAKELFKIINQHTKHLLNKEIDFINQQNDIALENYAIALNKISEIAENCGENSCVLRVGKHSGFQFMTGGWQQELMEENSLKDLKRYVRRATRTPEFLPLPKTRRFTNNGNPIGFVKLTIVNL
jgi:CRISPR type III-A-associated RAMP protein Csm5